MSAYSFVLHTKKHNTEKPSDPDKYSTYKATLASPKDKAKIGLETANLTLTLKGTSDQILHDFPRHGTFQITIKQLDPNNEDEEDEDSATIPTTMEAYS
jgi:hypothetical protein